MALLIIPEKEWTHLTFWQVIKTARSPYGYLSQHATEISQPYNKVVYYLKFVFVIDEMFVSVRMCVCLSLVTNWFME